jgi:hypothetical protein
MGDLVSFVEMSRTRHRAGFTQQIQSMTNLGRIHETGGRQESVVALEGQDWVWEHAQRQDQRRRHHVRVRARGNLLV